MTAFRNLPSTIIGRLGEQLGQRLLRQLGAGVIASFKFSGENDNEAPALEFHNERVTLPDYDVSLKGRRFWLELKTYKEPQWNRAHRCMVHGVPTRLIEQYERSEKETGTPVYLGVLEVSSGALLVSEEPISKIEPRYTCLCGCENRDEECDYRRKWGKGYPQWYFRRDSFREWSRLEGDALAKLQAEHGRLGHALRKRRYNEPAPKDQLAVAWSWACLACNLTSNTDTYAGRDPSRHRCQPKDYLVAYWTRRLCWAGLSVDDAKAFVAKPIDRQLAGVHIGVGWGA